MKVSSCGEGFSVEKNKIPITKREHRTASFLPPASTSATSTLCSQHAILNIAAGSNSFPSVAVDSHG